MCCWTLHLSQQTTHNCILYTFPAHTAFHHNRHHSSTAYMALCHILQISYTIHTSVLHIPPVLLPVMPATLFVLLFYTYDLPLNSLHFSPSLTAPCICTAFLFCKYCLLQYPIHYFPAHNTHRYTLHTHSSSAHVTIVIPSSFLFCTCLIPSHIPFQGSGHSQKK